MEDSALVNIQEGRYYLAVAGVGQIGRGKIKYNGREVRYNGADWMGCIWRQDDEPERWHIKGRIRYHVDDKVFNSQDVKGHYLDAVFTGPEEEALEAFVVLALLAADGDPRQLELREIRGGVAAFRKLLETNPPSFMHVQSFRLGPDGKVIEWPAGMSQEQAQEIVKRQRAR